MSNVIENHQNFCDDSAMWANLTYPQIITFSKPFTFSVDLLTQLPRGCTYQTDWTVPLFDLTLTHDVYQHGPYKCSSFTTTSFRNTNYVPSAQCNRNSLKQGIDQFNINFMKTKKIKNWISLRRQICETIYLVSASPPSHPPE